MNIPVRRTYTTTNATRLSYDDYTDSPLAQDEQLTEILMREALSGITLHLRDGSEVKWEKVQ